MSPITTSVWPSSVITHLDAALGILGEVEDAESRREYMRLYAVRNKIAQRYDAMKAEVHELTRQTGLDARGLARVALAMLPREDCVSLAVDALADAVRSGQSGDIVEAIERYRQGAVHW